MPFLVSHRRLADRRTLPRATSSWALDSGGFTELSLHGRWRTDAATYVNAVRRYATEIGNLDWAAPRDRMTEDHVLARTGLSLRTHQHLTVADYLRLRDLDFLSPGRPTRRDEGPEETDGMELILIGDRPLAKAAVLSYETGPDAVVIDARKIGFICPLDLAGVLAIAHWASASALPVTLHLPSEPGAASYFQRMDVLRRLPARTRIAGRPFPEKRADLRHRLLEASPLIAANVDDMAERVGNLVTTYYPGTAGPVVARA